MKKCALCSKPAQRLFAGRVELCFDHYQGGRLVRLSDADAEKLCAILKGPAAKVPAVPDATPKKRVSQVPDKGSEKSGDEAEAGDDPR